MHERVNHTDNYVNQATGYHTQGIERAWHDGKTYMRRARGPRNIESHLDEIAWRKKHAENDLLLTFLQDAVRVHGSESARNKLENIQRSTSSSTSLASDPIAYGCLCGEPIRVLPHYARDKLHDETSGNIEPINL